MIVRTLSIIQHKVIYECTTLKSKGKRKKEKKTVIEQNPIELHLCAIC